MLSKYGIKKPDILLPADGTDMSKWAVVACDQFTAQPEYWERVTDTVGDAPSTLNLICPEVWLDRSSEILPKVNACMGRYLDTVLTKSVNGFVLVERTIKTGKRLGLMACIDLEEYSFEVGSKSLIRPTEKTIVERIPARVAIRKDAPVELPHVLLLVDDPEQTLIEGIYAEKENLEKLYDFELMENGGHLRGWLLDNDAAISRLVEEPLEKLYNKADGMLFAVGDGNHSIASARQHWLNVKATLSEEEQKTHPARWALVEIENLHDPSLKFEPIHRVLYGSDCCKLVMEMLGWLEVHDMALRHCRGDEPMITLLEDNIRYPMTIDNMGDELPLYIIQQFLDEYVKSNEGVTIDYVHGEDAIKACAAKGDLACMMSVLDKHLLFDSVRKKGTLPRKAFSMGEAEEKRYYCECRKIK